MNNNLLTYKNVSEEINKIFSNSEKDIKNSILKKTRIRETSNLDALLYRFLYSNKEITQNEVVAKINKKNNKTTFINSFKYREDNISVDFYKNKFSEIIELYKKLKNIKDDKLIKIAVDGTFNNTNIYNKKGILETCLNLGFYDISNDVPLDITLEGLKNKNVELKALKEYLKKEKIKNKNIILLLDRHYCSYELIDFLKNNNYKFIIRVRNNLTEMEKKLKEILKLRIITYSSTETSNITYEKYINYINPKIGKNVKINKKDKISETDIFKSVDVTFNYKYTIVTNLNNKFYDDYDIKEIYKERWNIEVFFKLLKKNFKFEHLKEHNKNNNYDSYIKIYYVNLIIIYLAKIIEKTYMNHNYIIEEEERINKQGKVIIFKRKANKSLAIKGIYEYINEIINGKITENILRNLCKNYIRFTLREVGLSKERKAKTPFYKWYVKGHSNRSLIYKIIEAKITNNTEKLNKNHIVLYNNTIIKLNK